MPLMFLLAGLFTWSSLERKGPAAFLRSRLARLGVPFVAIAATLMPLAHYPSFKLTGATESFVGYWVMSAAKGPWPTGPLWFVWYLLALSVLATGLFVLLPERIRQTVPALGNALHRPFVLFPVVLLTSLLAYMPLMALHGRNHWFAVGPFAVQASRVGLYLVYFMIGVVVGAGASTDASWHARLHRGWWQWSLGSLLAFATLVAVLTGTGPVGSVPPALASALYGAAYVVFGATTTLAAISLFGRFRQRRRRSFDSLAANSYGIYLVHYVIVIWLHYVLLDLGASGLTKGFVVLLLSLSATWIAVSLARRSQIIRRFV